MIRLRNWTLAVALAMSVMPLAGQTPQMQAALSDANDAILDAERAGAAVYATALYEEARALLASARLNADHRTTAIRESARLDAIEAQFAAEAAEARANWIAGVREANDLRADIGRFGGTIGGSPLIEEPATPLDRGTTSRERVAYAENVVAMAIAAGAAAVDAEAMQTAEEYLASARGITRSQVNNASADYLAYTAEMMAREAWYQARLREAEGQLPGLRLERTRLAEQMREREAAAERQRREQSEREAERLRAQLEAERQSRQMREDELERLRQQVAENEARLEQQLLSDRQTRLEAEQRLAELTRQYEAALANRVGPVESDRLYRQLEDQQLALRAIQDRERISEELMQAEIRRLQAELDSQRVGGISNAQALDEREAELDDRLRELSQLREEREAAEARRGEEQAAFRSRIAALESRAMEAEQERVVLEQQVEAERNRASQAEGELNRLRDETTRREQEQRERIAQMERTLGEIAETRRDERGFIVTLPGIFFDTGKSALASGSRNTLSRIAEQLRNNPTLQIVVEGHTDSVGSDALNQSLSEKRAQSVRDYLVSQGFPPERISTVGRGENAPVASNDNAAGRQQNRRVELVIR